MNLLGIPWLKAALRSRLYPALFQWIVAGVFVTLLLAMLFGPNNAGQNFGMALTWTVWWALLPLSFLFLGRFWCAICPLAWLTDQVRRTVGVRLAAPRMLRRLGPWMIAATFILVTWLDEAWRFASDARKSGYLMLGVLLLVVFFAAFFERRTFCRDICFIGAFAANYSRAGMLELRADAERCRECPTQGCYRGGPSASGCPVSLFAPQVEDSGTCQLCGNCLKNCPHDAIRLTVRKPAAELWSVRQPHLSGAMLAAVLAGVVLIERFSMLGGWNRVVAAVAGALGLDPFVSFPLVYGVLMAMFLAAPLLALALAGLASQAVIGELSRAAIKRSFSLSGYAAIPLVLAGHLALGLDRLLTGSRTVPYSFAAMFGWFPQNSGAAWLSVPGAPRIELAVLTLGAAVSLYVAFRLARRHAPAAAWAAWAPQCVLLVALLGANLYPVAVMIW